MKKFVLSGAFATASVGQYRPLGTEIAFGKQIEEKFGSMKRFALLAFLIIPLNATSGSLPEGETLMTLRIDGEIEVDKEGRVRSHRLDTKLVDGLRELVDSAVARWMFVPPTVSGSLATVRSPMRITLAARSLDKDYSVTLDRVDFRSAHAASEKEAVKTDSPAL